MRKEDDHMIGLDELEGVCARMVGKMRSGHREYYELKNVNTGLMFTVEKKRVVSISGSYASKSGLIIDVRQDNGSSWSVHVEDVNGCLY